MIFKLLNALSLSALLTLIPLSSLLRGSQEARAQSSSRPYVVLVNGYQDCCAWHMNDLIQELQSMNADIRRVPWDSFQDRAGQRSNTSSDSLFISEGVSFIRQLDPNRPIIMIGHSYGGDSAIKLASRVTDREILFLGTIDPVSGGGLRAPITNHTITDNVRYFFNRWQENGLASSNVVPFDSRIDGNINKCNAEVCDQQEQSIARNADYSPTRISCEAHEVTCEGWRLPGCNFGGCWSGSNGTKQKRIYHNDMAQDAYIQRQIVEKVAALLGQEPTPSPVDRSQLPNSYLTNPVLDPDFYLLTYGDLRSTYGQQNPDGARQHWTLHGLSEARRSSPAFDVRYYRDTHSDLAEAFGEDYYGLVDHWLSHGIKEGRRSSLVFDVRYYLDKYPDLQQAFGQTNYAAALNHWLNFGVSEGRQGSSDFDPKFYLSSNPDVSSTYGANNYKGAISHYLEFGRSEGRNGTL